MKYSYSIFMAITLLISSNISSATDKNPPQAPIEITLAHEDHNAFPWVYSNKQQFIGLDIILINLVAQKLNITINYQSQPWLRALQSMQTGSVDGIFSASYEYERETHGEYPKINNKLDTSKRIHESAYSLYTLKDSPVYFDGKAFYNLSHPIGVQRGFSIISDLNAFAVPLSATTTDPKRILNQLLNGRISGAALQTERANVLINSDPKLKANLKRYATQQAPFQKKPYFIMFSTQFMTSHPDLAQKFWTTLKQIRNSKAYKRQRWIFNTHNNL